MPKHLPSNPNLENLKKQAKQLVKDHKAGQVEAFTRIKASFPRLADASVHEILAADFSLCNAQLVISREYGFTTWKELVEAVTTLTSFEDAFIRDNPGLRWVQTQIEQAASVDLPVLITGETGTGKGLAARTIHRLSARKSGPFVQVNCGAVSDILMESELFGHEKGAFTGAHARRIGKVETARGGTLFLDYIGDLSPAAQVKLLRLLEDHTFERVGDAGTLEADVRLMAATSRDLQQMVSDGAFRQDLAFLIRKVHLPLPPLRKRRKDILLLATHFIKQMAAHLDREAPRLSPEAEHALQGYDWPGNIRELEHMVQRAVVVCTGPVIRKEDIAF